MREPGFYDGILHGEYHADAHGPRLSASLAHVMLSRSPMHAWAQHPLLGNLGAAESPKERALRDRGTLLHALILGGGPLIEVVEADDWRTNAAKERRAEIEETGALAVLEPRYEEAMEISAGVRDSLREAGFAGVYKTERVVIWQENGVTCRGRFDAQGKYSPGHLADLKFVGNANPAAFARPMIGLGQDIKYAAYVSAVEHLIPELAGRVHMEFLLCEPFPPYAVCRCLPAGSMRSLGAAKWERAVKLWGKCLSSGKWPGYGTATVEAPQWAMTEDLAITVAETGDPDWLSGEEE